MSETYLAIRRADRAGIGPDDAYDYLPLNPGEDAWTLAADLSRGEKRPVTYDLIAVTMTVVDQCTLLDGRDPAGENPPPDIVPCPGQETLDLDEALAGRSDREAGRG